MFEQILRRFDRIAIAGGPRTGKTTVFAAKVKDRPVIHTDDYIGGGTQKEFLEAPSLVIREASQHRRFVVEGVQVARALRKGLEVDAVVWLAVPLEVLTKGRETQRLGVVKIFSDWSRSNKSVPIFNL